ncbi:MAG: DUF2189 domain-containing protein [Pseudomonadota bacterium]
MTSEQSHGAAHGRLPEIQQIGLDEPWTWLAAGWRDLWRKPSISLGYGLAIAVVSWVLTAGLFSLHLASVVIALAAGFLLVAPLLAVGLYELSRRLESGEPIETKEIVLVSTHSPLQLAFVGVALLIAFLVWVRIAMLLFALFFGAEPFPEIEAFVPTLLFTWKGLVMLIVGSLVGGLIAFAVFAISAVSVPLLMARDLDVMSAIITSLRATARNFKPMLLWACLIAALTACGIATGYLGLIITFPLIGHATWHAYRALVEP